MRLGAAAAPLNPAYTTEEFAFYLRDVEPCLLLLPEQQPAAVAAATELGTPTGNVVLLADSAPQLHVGGRELVTEAAFDEGDPEDVAIVLHTSGTTSRPKQVPLLQRNLMASVRTIAAHYRLDEGDRSFCAMPLFHVHGLVASALAALGSGGQPSSRAASPRNASGPRHASTARPGSRRGPRCTR